MVQSPGTLHPMHACSWATIALAENDHIRCQKNISKEHCPTRSTNTKTALTPKLSLRSLRLSASEWCRY